MTEQVQQKIKVMIVDDSTIIRSLMLRAIADIPDIEIVATAANGAIALEQLRLTKPDVVILDIEMPVMDGMMALPQIVRNSPSTKVIIASTLSVRNAEISLRALELGASDYLAKPNAQDLGAAKDFFRELIEKIRALAPLRAIEIKTQESLAPAYVAKEMPVQMPKPIATPRLVTAPRGKISAVAIASSTGGPQALQTLFATLKNRVARVPIFITQHMPPMFTTILAQNLSKEAGIDCHEGIDGEQVRAGVVYIAPGGFHMTIEKTGMGAVIRLNQDAQENFCRPAADPMLRSLSTYYGDQLLIAVLTGMGSDGAKGAQIAHGRGGTVIAQDEASCVVWGMPRAIAEANIASAILPLPLIADYIEKAVAR